MKLSAIQVDSDLVEKGTWISDIQDMGDLRLHVRGIGNTDYKRMQSKLYLATPRSDRVSGRLSPEASDRIQAQCLANTVLLGWEGLEDENGPLEFSKQLALKLLMNPDFVAFRDAVVAAATQVGVAEDEVKEDAAKNLATPSVGN